MSYGEKCPICGTKWTTTKLIINDVVHCRPCNKKAEDIIKQHKEDQEKKKKYNTWKPSKSSTSDLAGGNSIKIKNDWSDWDNAGLDDWGDIDWSDIILDLKTKSKFNL